jgi:hypothetical protein
VTTLSLGMHWVANQGLPHDIDLLVLFPRLHTIQLDLNDGYRDGRTWKKFFDDGGFFRSLPGSSSSVQQLILSEATYNIASDWLRNLNETFPDVKYLRIENGNFRKGTISAVCQIFAGLEEIHFDFRQFHIFSRIKSENLDSDFTGIPEQVCERLRSNTTNPENLTEDLEQLKTSIGLTKLTGKLNY